MDKFNVYYLDDEESLCDIFYQLFNSDKITITTFTDEKNAIDACNKNPPDLFFIDYRLHNSTGDKVALAINPDIPKILVTGDIHVNSVYEFQNIISKPFQIEVIKELINSSM